MTRLWLTFALLLWLPLAAMAGPWPRDLGPAANAEIRALLQDLPVMRVHMVSAPGNGHQSANLRIVQRLRELGYEGRIQVIYEPGVREKLGYLVPGFDAEKGALQKVTTPQLGTVEFVNEKEATEALTERVKLTISGARDELTSPVHRQKMNSDYFVQLQPKRWTIRGGERAIYVDGHQDPHALSHLRDLGPLTVPMTEASLAEQLERVRAVPEKGEALARLLGAGEKFDWMPAYSIDFTRDPDALMESLVKGLRKAAADPKFTRPIVVPILTELNDEALGSLRESMAALKTRVASITDSTLEARLAKAKPGEVVLVHVGRLPAGAFDTVVSRATLPVVLEGKNLTQSAMERGLPFLNVTGSLKDIEPELLAANAGKKAATTTRAAFRALDPAIYENTERRTTNALAAYFREAKQGSVADFFRALKVDAGSVEQDLTGRALLELKDVMAKTKPVAGTVPIAAPVGCDPLYRNLVNTRARGGPMNRDAVSRFPRRGGRGFD